MRNAKQRALGGTLCVLVLALAACGGGGSKDPAASDGGAGSTGSSDGATPSASASADPMSVARLDGLYNVVKKVVATKNFSDIKKGQSFKRTYDVTLACPTGPCEGEVVIDAEESKENLTQLVAWDDATHTYTFASPSAGNATCTGADGKKYELKTTNTFVLTPTAVDGPDNVVTTFTAVGLLKAVPQGAAQSKGKCRVSTAKYTYEGEAA
jgi:hypothetical protein